MDKDYFMNAGISPPQPLHFEPFPWNGLNCPSDQSFLHPNSSADQYSSWTSFTAIAATTTTSAAAASPLTSPLPILDQINMGSLGNSPPPLPSLAGDPGFAERAAKFSCFGSRSFNERTSLDGSEFGRRSVLLMEDPKLHRVSSSPILKQNGSPLENKKLSKLSGSANSNEESSVSEQIHSGEIGSKNSNDMNHRKRKGVSRQKPKENGTFSTKGVEGEEDGNLKRLKPSESSKNESKIGEEMRRDSNDEIEKQKANQKPPEPPKDYIHVRARRGQATDSHSLAERVRREKISERMKLLQDLVPGCNKVTGKALMLDEIINYVQSLQRQVEFLSMKLASVNPGLDFNMENILSKDMFQQNANVQQEMYPLDSSSPAYYNHQSHQNVQQLHNTNISVDPLPFQVPEFSETLPQFPGFSEDDLQSIVQMSFVQNQVNFPVQNQASNMKIEL